MDQRTSLASIIRERRTIRDFNGKPLDKELLLALLRDAAWAPFHSKKEPWRFVLFMGEGRKRFADAVIGTYSAELAERWSKWATEQYCTLIQAHLLVVIEADPRQKYWEDAFSAAAAFIQNFQLLAWEHNIGVVWKTNDWNWDPSFHRKAGIGAHERIVGALHIGYFDRKPKARARTPIEALLTVFDE